MTSIVLSLNSRIIRLRRRLQGDPNNHKLAARMNDLLARQESALLDFSPIYESVDAALARVQSAKAQIAEGITAADGLRRREAIEAALRTELFCDPARPAELLAELAGLYAD